MSKIREFREALAAHLVANVPGLVAGDIVVERNRSLGEMIARNVVQATKGLCVTIGPGRCRNIDEEAPSLVMDSFHTVTLWVTPIYQNGLFPEDSLFWPMMVACHGEKVAIAGEDYAQWRMVTLDSDDVPSPKYLGMEFRVKRLLQS